MTYQPKNQRNSTRSIVGAQVQPGDVRKEGILEARDRTYRLQIVVVQHELGGGEARLVLDGKLVGPMGDL